MAVKRGAFRIARALLIGLGALSYAMLVHLSNTRAGHESLGLLLGVGPLWLVAAALSWRSRLRVPALLACAGMALLIAARWPDLKIHYAWTLLIQQVGAFTMLGLVFGRTLVEDRLPLCTEYALRVHGTLDAATRAYTRNVTLAWTAFFAVVAATLLVLFIVLPLPVWSAIANFGTLPLVLLMFVAENLVRRRVLPHLEHIGALATIRAVTARAPHEPG